MGVTYAAYDGKLDRNIALKLVRSDQHASASAQARLQREAQALARIAHPNIVAVHDVGEYRGRLYITMELVSGQTLSQWCRTEQRSLAEVMEVFRQAGAGLAAAHAAGLVHRDFKPSNVMVGDDGRVRVLDFGLVRFGLDDGSHNDVCPDDDSHNRSSNVDDPLVGVPMQVRASRTAPTTNTLTIPGSILGTPAYMAPEQFGGADCDARSDQFSFSVSLYEALYGVRPFRDQESMADSATETRTCDASPESCTAQTPRSAVVPTRIRTVLMRALAYDPDTRWASMDDMLEQLDAAYRPISWRWIATAVLGAGVGIAMSLGFAVGALGLHDAGGDVCTGAERQLGSLWDAAAQQQVHAAFAATQLTHADDAWERVHLGVSQYRLQWLLAHTDACEATAVRHEQSEAVMDQRMVCLSERRQSLQHLVTLLAEVDAPSLDDAVSAVTALPRISSCADIGYLSARIKPPEDPHTSARIHAARADLIRVAELERFGELEQAREVLEGVRPIVDSIEYVPLSAELEFRTASLLLRGGKFFAAKEAFEKAFFSARASEHSEVGVLSAVELVFLLGYKLVLYDQAHLWVRLARSELAHTSMPAADVLLWRNEGILLENTGDANAAVDYYRRAVAEAEALYPPGHPEIGRMLNSLGIGLMAAGRYRDGSRQLRRALAIFERAWGGFHPTTMHIANALGYAVARLGQYDEAEALVRGSIAMVEQSWGPDHADLAMPMMRLGRVLLLRGQAADAEAAIARAIQVLTPHASADSPRLANLYIDLADSVRAQGRYRQAEDLYRRALGTLRKSLPANSPRLSAPMVRLAELGLDRQERLQLIRATGTRMPARGSRKDDRGEAGIDAAGALDFAERALALLESAGSDAFTMARVQFALARALRANNREADRARALAAQARTIYAGSPEVYRDELTAVETWMRQ